MAKIRVLLADDHAILRDGIHALLALQDDIEVVGEAADGREAIEKARQLAPDIVLMDIVMPLMDGLEACRRICKENPKTKVIVLTQYDNKEYVSSSVKAGAAGCISKRAVASELVSAIRVVHGGDYFLYPPIATMLVEDYLQRMGEAEADDYNRLTAREREVLKLVAEGHTNREIAELLVISVRTVIGHRTSLMEKLDIHNRSELVKYAIRKGLTSVDT